jgi:hypothetical protein
VWRAKTTIQAIDSAAKEEVGKAVEEAKSSPEPRVEDLWTDIYYKGTEPKSMRGREREEVCEAAFSSHPTSVLIGSLFAGSLLLSQRIKCGSGPPG